MAFIDTLIENLEKRVTELPGLIAKANEIKNSPHLNSSEQQLLQITINNLNSLQGQVKHWVNQHQNQNSGYTSDKIQSQLERLNEASNAGISVLENKTAQVARAAEQAAHQSKRGNFSPSLERLIKSVDRILQGKGVESKSDNITKKRPK